MKRTVNGVIALAGRGLPWLDAPEHASAADAPTDRVVVMYFHRTQRCPTCLKMGSYTEEAVKDGFAKEIKDGKVELHYIDFQDEKNAAFTKAYKVGGPTLIVAKASGNKVAEYQEPDGDVDQSTRQGRRSSNTSQTNVKDYMK